MTELRTFVTKDTLRGRGLPDVTLATSDTPLPDIPEVSIARVPGEHFGTTLKRYTGSNARAVLQAGTYEFVDNVDVNNYSAYTPRILGARGQGQDQTVLMLRQNSFTHKVARPGQAGQGVWRYGPNGGAGRVQRTLSDLSLVGTPQSGDDGRPMFFGGVINYYGQNELWKRVRVRGLTYGGGNSPNTGETFMVNDFQSRDSVYEDCDFDGRDIGGAMVSAAPIGFNASHRPRLIRCHIHHALYSGLTFSIAGSTTNPTNPTIDPYTEDCVMEWNANHPGVGSGSRFSGMNHEWVRGKIEHVRPTVILDQANLWDSNHISHGCSVIDDNPIPMIVRDPRWNASPTWARGLFTIKIWGNQKTLPLVYNAAGNLMRPVVASGANPPMISPVDQSGNTVTPQTHFAVSADTGYIAP